MRGGRQPFLLAGDLSPAPATYPEVVTERAAPPPLFGLAPHGVCPASEHYCRRGALLPHLFTLTRFAPGGTFSVALSVKPAYERAPPAVSRHAALWRPDFPPAPPVTRRSQRLPIRQARLHYQCPPGGPQLSYDVARATIATYLLPGTPANIEKPMPCRSSPVRP